MHAVKIISPVARLSTPLDYRFNMLHVARGPATCIPRNGGKRYLRMIVGKAYWEKILNTL